MVDPNYNNHFRFLKNKNMLTKSEAYQKMLDGEKVTHEYYSDEEYIFINSDGQFESEEGYLHGNKSGEFWTIYQKWENGWSIKN